MIGKDFRDCMKYSPILIYSSVFSCFTTFMGSIYIATKRSKRSLFTSLISGVVNVVLNIILIPRIGLYGPAISTVAAYLSVFIVRYIDSRRLIPFKVNVEKLVMSNILLIAMMLLNVMFPRYLDYLEFSDLPVAAALLILFAMIFVYNAKSLTGLMSRFLPKRVVNHFENASFAKDVLAFCFAVAAFGLIGAGVYKDVIGIIEILALCTALLLGVVVKKKRWLGYMILLPVVGIIVADRGLFAASIFFAVVILPCLVAKKRLFEMICLTAVTAAITGYYIRPLFAVFIILLFIPCYVLAFSKEIGDLIRKSVRK
jgi:hypothetical protein